MTVLPSTNHRLPTDTVKIIADLEQEIDPTYPTDQIDPSNPIEIDPNVITTTINILLQDPCHLPHNETET